MLNRHLFDGHDIVLVAISGGSDSLALLHLLNDANLPSRIIAATVDHGLREEAAVEADRVHGWCAALGIEHATLPLSSPPRSAREARRARYTALVTHSHHNGATCIALGHTLDDQAETVLMRALRMKEDSDTRGLAAMAPLTRLDGISLLRPLLSIRRGDLQRYLSERKLEWVDDPSNSNPASERVRVRQKLATGTAFPPPESLARLAGLCARSRSWLTTVAARAAREHVRQGSETICLSRMDALPEPVASLLIASAVRTFGARRHLPASRTLAPVLAANREGRGFRHAIGGCLVTTRKGNVTIQRECKRRNKPAPTTANPATLFIAEQDWSLHAALGGPLLPPTAARSTHLHST